MSTFTLLSNTDCTTARHYGVLTTKLATITINSSSTPGWEKVLTTRLSKGNLQITNYYGYVHVFRNLSGTSSETLIIDANSDTNVSDAFYLGPTFYTSQGSSFQG